MTDYVLDLRGLKCPLPVLKARKKMKSLSVGDRLILECTDPMTVIDVPHFAGQDGHRLASQESDNTLYIYAIEKLR